MSEFGGLQKHENIQHAPILGYEARHCCCWPAEGSPNFPLGKGTKYNRKTENRRNTITTQTCAVTKYVKKNTNTKTPTPTVRQTDTPEMVELLRSVTQRRKLKPRSHRPTTPTTFHRVRKFQPDARAAVTFVLVEQLLVS